MEDSMTDEYGSECGMVLATRQIVVGVEWVKDIA